LHQVLGEQHVVVGQKEDVGSDLWLAHETYPFMEQGLPSQIRRMRFAGEDELHRVGLPPELTQTVKTLFAVRWKSLDRQEDCTAYWGPAGEAEAGSGGDQPAKE
jgi:hypothetical protein